MELIINGESYSIVDVKKEHVFDYIDKIKTGAGVTIGYKVIKNGAYYSEKYNDYIVFNVNDKPYDGATGAIDIPSFSWLLHDICCREGMFASGRKCTNWQASSVCRNILRKEGRWFRARTWFVATWFFGGGNARKNGMW